MKLQEERYKKKVFLYLAESRKKKDNECKCRNKNKRRIDKTKTGNESVKTLGVHLNPIIEWKDQRGHVKNKMKRTIRKLMRTDIKDNQTCMCFNMHVLTNVFLEAENQI